MNEDQPIERRLVSERGDADPVFREAASFIDKVRVPVRFNQRMVERALNAAIAGKHRPARAPWAAFATAIALSLGGAGLVVAAHGLSLGWLREIIRPLLPGATHQSGASTPRQPPPVVTPLASPTAPPLGAVSDDGRAPLATHHSGRDGAKKLARVEAPAVPSQGESPLTRENRLLGRALSELRQGRSPERALEHIGNYVAEFPDGILAREASVAKAEALLKLGRTSEVLAVLDSLRLEGGQHDLELRTIRGELRASTNCARALDDLEFLLESSAADRFHERALYAAATCQEKLGQSDAAERSYRGYLRRFPQGRHAPEVRDRLAR